MNIPSLNQRQPIVDNQGTIDQSLSIKLNQVFAWITENSQHGTTAQRPTENLYIGRLYRDDTLGYHVHVHSINPTVWKNEAGVSV